MTMMMMMMMMIMMALMMTVLPACTQELTTEWLHEEVNRTSGVTG